MPEFQKMVLCDCCGQRRASPKHVVVDNDDDLRVFVTNEDEDLCCTGCHNLRRFQAKATAKEALVRLYMLRRAEGDMTKATEALDDAIAANLAILEHLSN